jgi:hypothetical protein
MILPIVVMGEVEFSSVSVVFLSPAAAVESTATMANIFEREYHVNIAVDECTVVMTKAGENEKSRIKLWIMFRESERRLSRAPRMLFRASWCRDEDAEVETRFRREATWGSVIVNAAELMTDPEA